MSTKRTRTPDIGLPVLPNKDWADVKRMLCVDESLNNSGAALFVDGKYVPNMSGDDDIGFALTPPRSMSQLSKIVAYDRWIRGLITEHKPDVVVLESHPFIRGNMKTSIATLEVLIGVRYVAMVACGTMSTTYVEFSTNHVKMIMCGSSSASKEMIQLVLSGCGYTLPVYANGKKAVNDNVCDAIAMGEVLARMAKQELLIREHIQSVGPGRTQTRTRNHLAKAGQHEVPAK